jgi:nicotinamide mononucleotide (NMN) deamidase PncC
VAETLTGGLMSTRLSAAPGAETAFKGGVVVADGGEELRAWLNVPDGSLASPDAVQALAAGVARVTGAAVGLAAAGSIETVAAGPPVGTVFLGMTVNGEAVSQRIRLPGRLEQMRQFTAIGLLNALRLRLLE